ncbi:MAG: DUF1768 domain-containing protein [Clostridia bacterium]|nr:DUF1768 domain-containing protein [Clostridia bacterium]
MSNALRNHVLDGMLGLAVGDALGVPFEFRSRREMEENPATDMIGYGTYHQPEGSWSDDTSMALCTADSLIKGFDPEDMMKKFSAWKSRAQYTATGVRFDIGISSRKAIEKYEMGLDPADCGDAGEYGNGNGALMRIFPAAIMQCIKAVYSEADARAFLDPVHRSAMITHAHERGLICCGIYTMILHAWLNREESQTLEDVMICGFERAQRAYTAMGGRFAAEMAKTNQFIHPRVLAACPQEEIGSSGYVIHTLHAALWCLLTTQSYAQCVLKAVNLGEDTDTTAAVAGSLAGVIYGVEAIPQAWLDKLKNRALIESISSRLSDALYSVKPEKQTIDSFTGEHTHLALKFAARIDLDGIVYQNATAAWLAQGTAFEERKQFCHLNAHQARRLFKRMTAEKTWDPEEKEAALYRVCMAKYSQNPELSQSLLATGVREIIYDTTGAHDNEMGRCACSSCAQLPYQNRYGKLLMRVRECLADNDVS